MRVSGEANSSMVWRHAPQGMRLPPSYSLFGKVISGLDVVAAIDAIGHQSGKPKERVIIESVTITESA